MNKANRYSPEVRERAVRMVFEHEREYCPSYITKMAISSRYSHVLVVEPTDHFLFDDLAAGGRLARPRIGPCDRRYNGPSLQSAVELRLGKKR